MSGKVEQGLEEGEILDRPPLEPGGLNSPAQIPLSLERLSFTMQSLREEGPGVRLLNEDERDMAAMCVQTLAERYPVRLAKSKQSG